jgi:penicillin-binding protein-related factor A (putative recombinase)
LEHEPTKSNRQKRTTILFFIFISTYNKCYIFIVNRVIMNENPANRCLEYIELEFLKRCVDKIRKDLSTILLQYTDVVEELTGCSHLVNYECRRN